MKSKLLKHLQFTGNNWHLIAPFIFVIELSVRQTGKTHYPVDPKWIHIIEQIIPYADKFMFEGEEPLLHPDIDEIINTLEANNCHYDFLTQMKWENPRSLLRKLQSLRGLDRFRIALPNFWYRSFAESQKNIELASASGFKTWLVLPIETETFDNMKDIVRLSNHLKISGVSIAATSSANSTGLTEKDISSLLNLKKSGLSIYIEYCLPIESNPINPPLITPHCNWHEGICIIDGYGNVKKCKHSEKSFGNIISSRIEHIWAKIDTDLNEKKYRKQLKIENNTPNEMPSIELDEALLPIPLYRLRQESFGAILINGYDFVKISERAIKILEIIDGEHSLKHLYKKFGRESLSFVYGLFERNMIRFNRKV